MVAYLKEGKENTMDLRIVKTKNQIWAAYLALRDKLMPEKIKVKDICEMAQINKTTFYKHYNDSMELSNEIDDNAVERVMNDFPQKKTLFSDPKGYIQGLLSALEGQRDNLRTVFRGKPDILCSKLEEKLRDDCEYKTEDISGSIGVSFAIGGFVRVVNDYLMTDKSMDISEIARYTVQIIERLIGANPQTNNV